MRRRLRELGYAVGRFPTGERNALVDVPGVLVGHRTLIEGERLRTGVTAILPHGDNLYAEKVLGACHVINGYGKAAGLSQLAELGTVESPMLLTCTLSVGPVWEGGLRHVLERTPDAARDRDTVNVIVGECFDGWLSDARALAVRPEHALEAIAAASATEAAEGAVGAGTGTTCFGFKSGVGTSSRVIDEGHVLGCLVVSNYGSRRDLHMLVGPVEAPEPAAEPPSQGGSIMIVLGTDAPLGERQLGRLAARATFGLGPSGLVRHERERRVRARVLHRPPRASPQRGPDASAEPPARRLRGAARALRGRRRGRARGGAGLALRRGRTSGRDGNSVEAFPYELLASAPGVRPL